MGTRTGVSLELVTTFCLFTLTHIALESTVNRLFEQPDRSSSCFIDNWQTHTALITLPNSLDVSLVNDAVNNTFTHSYITVNLFYHLFIYYSCTGSWSINPYRIYVML